MHKVAPMRLNALLNYIMTYCTKAGITKLYDHSQFLLFPANRLIQRKYVSSTFHKYWFHLFVSCRSRTSYMPKIRHEGHFFVLRPTDLTWISHFITIKCNKHCCSSHYLQLKVHLVLTFILKYEGRSQLREENALTNAEFCCRRIIAESTFLKLNTCVSSNMHIHFYLLHSHIHFSPL